MAAARISGAALAALMVLGLLAGVNSQKFVLPKLPATFFGSHEPAINAQTDDLHYNKHHASAVTALNTALANYTSVVTKYKSLTKLLMDLGSGRTGLPADVERTVRNQGGSVWNHAMFWRVMTSAGSPESQTYAISGELNSAITKAFGTVQNLTSLLNTTGQRQFGSGWTTLVWNKATGLSVCGFPNQDNALMGYITNPSTCKPYNDNKACTGIPIFGIDVWEHGYYLKFFQDRTGYLNSYLTNIVNWKQVSANLVAAKRADYDAIIGETEKPVYDAPAPTPGSGYPAPKYL